MTKSFISVAKTGSISDAAQQLGLTQSALSRRIQQYEEQLGAPLLSRSRKGVELTEVGKLAFTEGQHLLATFAKLQEEIAQQLGLEGGTVRIGGGATAVSFILPQAIAAFQNDHPKVLFQMKEAGSAEITQDVSNGRLELGIVTLPVQSANLNTQTLLDDEIVLVARLDHPLTHKKQINSQELANYAFVSFEAETALRKIIDSSTAAVNLDINVVMELRSIPAILRMVLTTGHLAFVSRLAIESQAGVVEINVNDLSIQRRMAVISRKRTQLSSPSEAFIKQLLVD